MSLPGIRSTDRTHRAGVGTSLRRRQAVVALAGLLCTMGARASTPPELHAELPTASLAGSSRFRYWGFAVYDARLWVQPGFSAQNFERHPFALQLDYLRDFSNAAISERAIAEMERQARPTPERRMQWQQWLHAAFPDVRKGDRITGVHRPGQGALFLTNGRLSGMVPDALFARLFFGIWLSAGTSEPALRQALLANLDGS